MTAGEVPAVAAVARLLRDCRRIVALTGAGCSTASGIPDYRDADGSWKHAPPVLFPDFVNRPEVRHRYWARSTLGWPRFVAARPNAAHLALAELEARGLLGTVITQNVDGLHQRAGSRQVIDLHGRLDTVRCLGCEARLSRATWQTELTEKNPHWAARAASLAPDGDAEPVTADYAGFHVPPCQLCGGVLKPDVVFYGEAVPAAVSSAAQTAMAEADGILVVGSSLMVYSGFRLVRDAAAAGKWVAAINLGRTRADELLAAHWREDCTRALPTLLTVLGGCAPQRSAP